MKILCLYNNDCALELFKWLQDEGNETILWKDKLDIKWCQNQKIDLTVSYTYRYIINSEILNVLDRNVVNLHNSYLPWNRGADPNIWSILENTPRGVTLHYVDEKLDHGDIIAQQLVGKYSNEDTLKTTYDELDRAAKQLFKNAFAYYDFWNAMRKETLSSGTFHKLSDTTKIKEKSLDYETKIEDFIKIFTRPAMKSQV